MPTVRQIIRKNLVTVVVVVCHTSVLLIYLVGSIVCDYIR